MTHPFEDVPDRDILRFAAENPLAWIVPAADPTDSLLMPLMIEADNEGTPRSILGHLPRNAPATVLLRTNPSAVCLFLGPHSYVSPGWVSKPDWAPTWNFLSLKVWGDLVPDAALTDTAVRRLALHMEARAGSDWSVEKIGDRYEGLLRGITGFRMQITGLKPRFKTGQDETETSRAEIFAALAGHPLQGWMP